MEQNTRITVAFISSRRLDQDEMEEDEEEEDDDDDDFDFSTAGIKSKLPGKRIVEMKVLESCRIFLVKCRLPWTWQWMRATIELWYPMNSGANNAGNQLMQGKFKVIQCHLDPSDGHMGVAAISLFLRDAGKNEENVEGGGMKIDDATAAFAAWMRQLPSHLVKLASLEKLMNLYQEGDPNQRSNHVDQFRHVMASSLAGQVYSLATNQPTFFRAAPILFPKKIMSIMIFPEDDAQSRAKKLELLEKVEVIAKEAPWKFGFSEVMYRETRYSSLEAPLFALRNTWFFPDLSFLQRTALVTYDVFKVTCRSRGHTYLLHRDMPTHFTYYNRDREGRGESQEAPSEGQLYSVLEFLIEHEVLKREVRGGEERFHLSRFWKAEEGIVCGLEKVLEGPEWLLSVDLDDHEVFGRIQSDAQQMAAARSIVRKAITMVSGRGGTGKTEVVSAVLKAAEAEIKRGCNGDPNNSLVSEDGVDSNDSCMTSDGGPVLQGPRVTIADKDASSNGPILYCAPTGKAASVIKKRVGSKAFTIHQVLASYKLWRSGTQEQPWKFAETRVVAVDECSMVSIEIFHLLLKYLLEGAHLAKLVLLGDHLQLPSVDPGNFMEDLYIALKPRGFTVNLLTNHRSEGNIIFENATRISQQQMPVFDTEKGFTLLLPNNERLSALPPSVRAGSCQVPPSTACPPAVVKGRGSGKEPDPAKVELYWALLRNQRERFGIEDDEKSQIISFLNNECNALNQFGCFVYNRHNVWGGDGKKMRKQFHVGDKIICTKNSDIPIYVDEGAGGGQGPSDDLKVTMDSDGKYEEPASLALKTKNERLMNGNMYKIRAFCRASVVAGSEEGETEDLNVGGNAEQESPKGSTSSKEYFVLDDLTGEVIRACPRLLMKKTKITHAWALSIHKFQGSEAEVIIYGLSGSGYESWRHVYTAVTRGKRRVVIVGSYQQLERAVKKKPTRRQTALGERVKKMLGVLAKKATQERVEKEVGKVEKENIEGKARIVDNEGEEVVCISPTLEQKIPSDKANSLCFTPTKLSTMFEDSMRDWGSQEEVLADVFKSDSPGKRTIGGISEEPAVVVKKVSKGGIPHGDGTTHARRILEIATGESSLTASENFSALSSILPSRSTVKSGLTSLERIKRAAADSPASYRTACVTSSPATFQVNRVAPGQQQVFFDPNDSFSGLDCSQLEEEAIQASQAIDVRRNLEMDIFDTDDEEGGCVDKSGSWKGEEVDMFDTDDEDLHAAVKEM